MIKFEYVNEKTADVSLPRRATSGSSGYDFYCPRRVEVKKGQTVLVETNVRFICDNPNYWLMLMPRSGLGFKYGMRLLNTIGNVDSDYWQADNKGHIMAKIAADEDFVIEKGDRFMQGVIVPCLFVDDDMTDGRRTGGLGSTGLK